MHKTYRCTCPVKWCLTIYVYMLQSYFAFERVPKLHFIHLVIRIDLLLSVVKIVITCPSCNFCAQAVSQILMSVVVENMVVIRYVCRTLQMYHIKLKGAIFFKFYEWHNNGERTLQVLLNAYSSHCYRDHGMSYIKQETLQKKI
jgi:hypothetical protein